MLRNNLKELLPDGWESMFKHRENWDPEGYSVAAFKLKETDKREIVLAKFDKTGDVMDYFFDDKPDDYIVDLNKAIKNFLKRGSNNSYRFSKKYIIYGGNFGKDGIDLNNKINDPDCKKDYYPKIGLCGGPSIGIHRLVAFLFVPNPYPDKYSLVNHIDTDKTNFKKENLEWCDEKWNSKRENQKAYKVTSLYLRKSDNKIFTRSELAKEYGTKQSSVVSSIHKIIKSNKKYKGSSWEIINPTLSEYLLKHPLRDNWYPHPIIKNLFANACGVIKFNNKLKIGSLRFKGSYIAYYITINNKRYLLHRLLAECYFGRILLDSEVIDHINPGINDIDNSIDNLKICSSQKENMNNEKTRLALSFKTVLSDLFGNNIKIFSSKNNLFDSLSMKRQHNDLDRALVLDNNYLVGYSKPSIENKLNYIYYKWEIDEAGKMKCIKACKNLGPLSDNYNKETGHEASKLRKYLNTGMPAPDGYYYQQGTPGEMIYDPENTKLEKKRPEIHWKDRNKEQNPNL